MMQRIFVIFFALTLFIPLGCKAPVSSNPDDYVGEYVFMPANADPGNFASFVILKKDQTALEIRFLKNTGEVRTTQTKWDLSRTTGWNISIGSFSHPIERTHSSIRLMNDADLGLWYEKVR